MAKKLSEKVAIKQIDLNLPEINLKQNKTIVRDIGLVLGRSLFPITAIALIMGSILWGPWVSLILAVVWFLIVLIKVG